MKWRCQSACAYLDFHDLIIPPPPPPMFRACNACKVRASPKMLGIQCALCASSSGFAKVHIAVGTIAPATCGDLPLTKAFPSAWLRLAT